MAVTIYLLRKLCLGSSGFHKHKVTNQRGRHKKIVYLYGPLIMKEHWEDSFCYEYEFGSLLSSMCNCSPVIVTIQISFAVRHWLLNYEEAIFYVMRLPSRSGTLN